MKKLLLFSTFCLALCSCYEPVRNKQVANDVRDRKVRHIHKDSILTAAVRQTEPMAMLAADKITGTDCNASVKKLFSSYKQVLDAQYICTEFTGYSSSKGKEIWEAVQGAYDAGVQPNPEAHESEIDSVLIYSYPMALAAEPNKKGLLLVYLMKREVILEMF